VIVLGLGYTALDYMLYYRLIDYVGENERRLRTNREQSFSLLTTPRWLTAYRVG
jgi:hypothetical protein